MLAAMQPIGSTLNEESPPIPASSLSAVGGPKKRVRKACDTCRRLKEKCDGRHPCGRCRRTNHQCRFRETRLSGTRRTEPPEAVATRSLGVSDNDFHDQEKIAALELIVKQVTGSERFDKDHLAILAASIDTSPAHAQIVSSRRGVTRHEPDSSLPLASTEELSHHDFSRRFQRQVGRIAYKQITGQPAAGVDIISPGRTHSQSTPSIVIEATSSFPPRDVALFLAGVFFEFVQTNYFYVDEIATRQSILDFYSAPITIGLGIEDAPWACIVLIVFAIGMQYAHLAARPDVGDNTDASGSTQSDHDIAQTFYHYACRLIPDVIAAATVDSVQALVLLAVYSLPIDAVGLSNTYVGTALRIAVRNGMHREQEGLFDTRQVELRRGIFWTAFTLERRICIFHGLPTSISKNDVDCQYPQVLAVFQTADRIDSMPNIVAMLQLTERLETAKQVVTAFKTAQEDDQPAAARSMSHFKEQLEEYWQSLPSQTFCRDFSATGPLFRPNQHLALTYHLIHIVVGRSFLLTSDPTPPTTTTTPLQQDSHLPTSWHQTRLRLIRDSVSSALSVIEICQSLHLETGLARSSHTEFTICCAAVLVLLAHRAVSNARRVQGACEVGIRFLREEMSVGIFSSGFERLTVGTLEEALGRLQEEAAAVPGTTAAGGGGGVGIGRERRASAYALFREWAAQRGDGAGGRSGPLDDDRGLGRAAHHHQPGNSQGESDLAMMPASMLAMEDYAAGRGAGFVADEADPSSIVVAGSEIPQFEFGSLATSVPGLDQWFDLGFH